MIKLNEWPPWCDECGMRLKKGEPIRTYPANGTVYHFHTHRNCFDKWAKKVRNAEPDIEGVAIAGYN